jgi:predicted nucleotidyltransferase
MGSPPDSLIRDLAKFGRKVARRFAIERIILFGSRASGRPRPDSDVDLIVVGRRFRRKNPIDRAVPLHLAWDLELPVDFLCYTPEEFNELAKRPSIVREALREGVRIPL